MNKKICELCLSPDLGGLELYMFRLSQFLGENCISVVNESGKLREKFHAQNLSFVTLKRRKVLLSWMSARALASIIDKEEIDILHLHWTKDLPVAIMAKLLSKRHPKVVQSRHMTMTRFKNDFFHRFLYKNLDGMIAVTQQVKAQIQKFVPSDICPKIEVSYIGANQPVIISNEDKKERRKELGLAESFTVGIVGRIEPQKGQWVLIDAIELLIKKGIDVKALIVGHAMSEGYLQALSRDIVMRGLQDRIVFTGFTNEAQAMMQVCDVVVLATENETFGMVLIEAMMCGVCVVASDSGGPLEIIDDGVNGLLFKTFDPSALAQKLETLQKDELLWTTLAIAGKTKALDMFEGQKQFEKLETILKI
jgi:glycosyltransferase involved in cell wall biosynthesis